MEKENIARKNGKSFLENINLLKGWGIFLVVFGHLPFIQGLSWYWTVRTHIYSFHMPLFMVISGYLFDRFAKNKISNRENYLPFLLKKVRRFVPAYIFTATVLFVVKFCIGKIVSLKHPVNLHSFFMMFINPMDKGFVVHLWFVYTLFLIFLLYPLLEKILCRWDVRLRLVFYFAISLIPVTHLFCLNLVIRYLVYFHLGGMINQNKRLDGFVEKSGGGWLGGVFVLFLAGNYARGLVDGVFLFNNLVSFITAFLGTLFSWFLISRVMKTKSIFRRFFNLLGLFSFEIYLFHTLGSETLGYSLRFVLNKGILFYSLNILLGTFCGLFIPIFLTKMLTQYCPKVAKVVLARVK